MLIQRRLLPSLSELIAFESAARLGSFTQAAKELSLTQGAISRQIANLETTLGLQLFSRIRRSTVLTDVGRFYLSEVSEALRDLVGSGVRARGFGASASLSLAVLPTFATHWLIPRLPGLLAHPSKMSLNLRTRLEPFDFKLEPFDAAIYFGSGAWPGTAVDLICPEDIVAVASPALLRRMNIRQPGDLARAPLLHQLTRPLAWPDWFERFGVRRANMDAGQSFDQFSMIAAAAVAGIGVALLPSLFIKTELEAGLLAAVPGGLYRSQHAYWLVVPEHKSGSPLVEKFRAWVKNEALQDAEAASPDVRRGGGAKSRARG